MNEIYNFDPKANYCAYIIYDQSLNGHNSIFKNLELFVDELIDKISKLVPRGNKLSFYCQKLSPYIGDGEDPAQLRRYLVCEYNPGGMFRDEIDNTMTRRLEAKFQKLWAEPLAIEFNYTQNWTAL